MNAKPQWLTTRLHPDKEINFKPVIVRDRTGREIKAHLEVEDMNSKGQLVVSAHYNSSPDPTVAGAPAKFYFTQEQMESFERDGEHSVLTVSDPVSAIKFSNP